MTKKIVSRMIVFKVAVLLSVGLTSFAHALPPAVEDLFQEGDLIFQRSQTSQAQAIYEATGSRWTHVGVLIKESGAWKVYEAIQPVTITALDRWVDRAASRQIRVLRPKILESGSIAENIRKVKRALASYYGKSYDIFFEWTDSKIYCSELIYKAYDTALGTKLGLIQKWKDMNLEAPAVRQLIHERLTKYGKELDLEQPIITPVAQMQSTELRHIYETPGSRP